MATAGEPSMSEQKYLEAQGVPIPPEMSQGTIVPQPVPQPTVPQSTAVIYPPMRKVGIIDTWILAFALGFLGAHHFYLGRPGFGATYLFTFGLLGVGYLVDLFRVPCLVQAANNKVVDPTLPEKKSVADAYLLWFPLGFLGLHHFYLRRWGWGFAYLFTFGLLGVGWIIDGFRLIGLVADYNSNQQTRWPVKKNLCDAYILTLMPFTGLLGVQHYYLDRIGMGVCYTCTLGFMGVGYLVDIVRMPFLVKYRNKEMEQGATGKVRLDDAYLLLFPLGFLGLHHFYLRRYGWGLLYLCTVGLFGIGWLIDFCRLPSMVADYNREVDRLRMLQSGQVRKEGIINQGAIITVTTTTGLPYTGGQNFGHGQVYPQQLPPYQPPYGGPGELYPQAPVYPENGGYPGYGAQGPESYSTVTSSEGDMPPSYAQATDESLQNSLNDLQSWDQAPTSHTKGPAPGPSKKE